MKISSLATRCGISALALTIACARDTEVIGPAVGPKLVGLSSVAAPYSPWSPPRSLGPPINSEFMDQQATLSKDGLTLYFSSNRPISGNSGPLNANIWVARRTCTDPENPVCDWGEPTPLGPEINTPDNDANPNLSRDGHRLFVTSTRQGEGRQGSNDLWVSYRESVHEDFGPRGWQVPVNLSAGCTGFLPHECVNSTMNEAAPNFFANEDIGIPQLYFNRQTPPMMPDGDLYVSSMNPDGTWGPPKAVAELNSAGTDLRSSIHHNGLEIFFWSNRTGTNQIWHAVRASVLDPWSPPQLVDPLSPNGINGSPSTIPFIHAHGSTETLYFVRDVGPNGAPNPDLFMSTRTRRGGGQ